jgi:sugar transferase (PEP-CTERM/EpsH1 system associated)
MLRKRAAVCVVDDNESGKKPLVAHIIHRLAVGGLENGLVNLINHTPAERYRHAIVALTEVTDFRNRIHRKDVPVFSLHKSKGQDFNTYGRLFRVLRTLHPDIVHTRNLGTLEYLVPAAFAGIACRIHGEHGRDVYDLDGSSPKYKFLRKAVNPFVSCYTAVSNDLAQWLERLVGNSKVVRICNGVDTQRFYPRTGVRLPFGPDGFVRDQTIVVGTVGRMHTVKDQLTLVRAFLHLIQSDLIAREKLRLVMIGDGPLREKSQKLLVAAGADGFAWAPGERADIPEILRAFDLFVLPSIAEGISNTILEAMASGLPVVATHVGGNPELVEQGRTGMLVPPSDPAAMAEAIRAYLHDPDKLVQHGLAGRKKVDAKFSIESMVNGYMAVYDAVLANQRHNSRKQRRFRSIRSRLTNRSSLAPPYS